MTAGIVAIIGRPNVGKSTLFNRMTSSDDAIVDDRPGVTRDRLYGHAWLSDDHTDGFVVIDTGGFETDDYNFQPFADNLVWHQTQAAITEADLVLFVLDGKSGLHPHDKELMRYLEQHQKPYICVVNKIDGPEQAQAMWEFYELGIGELLKISAAHNRGVYDLKEDISNRLKALPHLQHSVNAASEGTRIAIIGRPNAGKSSLLNRLTGTERALVSEIAGTTRDAVDTPLTFNKEKFILVDTAGIRRKSKVSERLETLSVMRSLRAMDRAEVVFLVIDATEGLTDQDAKLVSLATDRFKPVAIIVNKWDLFENKTTHTAKEYTDAIHRILKEQSYVPVVFVSCLENQRVHKLLELAQRLAASFRKRVETRLVNEALAEIVLGHTPALVKGKTKRIKFFYATQVRVCPPTIVIKGNVAQEILESYKRYMTKRFRELLGFDAVPLRLLFRAKTAEGKQHGSSSRGRDESGKTFEDFEDAAAFEEADAEDDYVASFNPPNVTLQGDVENNSFSFFKRQI
jgi:GTP-binding protein